MLPSVVQVGRGSAWSSTDLGRSFCITDAGVGRRQLRVGEEITAICPPNREDDEKMRETGKGMRRIEEAGENSM